jgi:hypothetical protein
VARIAQHLDIVRVKSAGTPLKLREGPIAVAHSLLTETVVARLRLAFVCVAGVTLAHLVSDGTLLYPRFENAAHAFERAGLELDVSELPQIVAQAAAEGSSRFVVRASEPGAPADLWVAEAVVARDGQLAELGGLHNLTNTSSADETSPVRAGDWVLVARRIGDDYVGFELFDLTSEPPTEQGVRERLQRGITNLQMTGTWAGVGRRSYTLRTPGKQLEVGVVDGSFRVVVDGVPVRVDPAMEEPREGASLVEIRSRATVVTEFVPWAVDTARAIPWIGSEGIAWLENKVFALRDRAKQAYHSVNTVDHASEAAAELGFAPRSAPAEEARVERLSVPDPETGWPPPAIAPLMTPEVAGEGKWHPIVDDPYARALPDGTPIFFQSFVRADPARDWARVYLTVWDPRVVGLHIVPGTAEPVSATGETGSGTIPRTKTLLPRLVAAFNGGFQAVHGEFGMMAGGRVYLPPKPWAATVAVFRDGRVGMGSWPGPTDRKAAYDEARAVASIPEGMVAYRQNLTSLVEDGAFNPWGRWWWGAAPSQKSEQTLTQRSALCITREGFMVYAWGDSCSPEALGAALVAARCTRAMHLDMNAGHSGMEFYNVLAPEEARIPRGPKAPSVYEGTLPELPGYTLRARKAVTSMGMQLPRYIHPDPRDYFFLALKPGVRTLPGTAALSFSSADLPHAGWPPAFARAANADVRVLRIDPARAIPRSDEVDGSEVLLAELRGQLTPSIDDLALYAVNDDAGTRYAIGAPPPDHQALMRAPDLGAVPDARAALGVDGAGLLVYVETTRREPGALKAALDEAGVSAAMALPGSVRLGLQFKEGLLGTDGSTRIREPAVALRFVAASSPALEVLFPDNHPIPYARWAGLQDQRVRYFRTAAPTSKAPPSALDTH